MPHRRPPRLRTFAYLGTYRYFVTCCTAERRRLFVDAEVVNALTVQIQHTCNERRFALLAYVFMPDHLHMLLQGLAPDSNFVATMTLIRQRTSIAFHERQRIILWQRGYFERVLRDEETTEKVACYLLANPVRAGLVTRAEEYPHLYCWRNIDCARAK